MRSKCLVRAVFEVFVCLQSGLLPAETQVNVRTAGTQANAAVAVDAGGGAIVVWSSYFTSQGRSNDILARRLDPNGEPAGDEFQVNAAGAGNQTEPAVAMSRGGDFVVVWHGPGLEEEDIFLRLFDSDGRPQSDEMLVNLAAAGRQVYPAVAADAAGRFVVAWESQTAEEDVERTCIRAQLFDPNGAGLGPEIVVHDDEADNRYPDVAMNGRGGFAATWLRERSVSSVMARLFDANGIPVCEAFEVSTVALASLTRPSIAMNAAGGFVIVWDGDPNRASADDIHARIFDPNGTPRTGQFIVNTLTEGAQQWPQVATSDANEFVVVWQHETDDPNVATDILARRLGAAGPAGEPFQLNAHVLDKQRYPDVATRGDGAFVATWESNGQDGSGYGIFAHLVGPAAGPDVNEPAIPVQP